MFLTAHHLQELLGHQNMLETGQQHRILGNQEHAATMGKVTRTWIQGLRTSCAKKEGWQRG